MKKKKYITKIIIITLIMSCAFLPVAYCEESGTVRMEINNGDTWVNTTISESYEACEKLNSTSSTLGTAALEAHLTTDYDWSIMAILAASQYGASTVSNLESKSTTLNDSGVYDINASFKRQATGLVTASNSTSTQYVGGLYNTDGTLKKYVNKIDPYTGVDDKGRTCVALITQGGTLGWMGATVLRENWASKPISTKIGLFGISFGSNKSDQLQNTGGRYKDTTFRPVIWN